MALLYNLTSFGRVPRNKDPSEEDSSGAMNGTTEGVSVASTGLEIPLNGSTICCKRRSIP